MKKRIAIVTMGLLMFMGIGVNPAGAEQALRFSCSAQLHDILQDHVLNAFSRTTGVRLDLTVSSSEAALYRLYNKVSDVAGTAERVYFSSGDYGYIETQVCNAPIVVITHANTAVDGVTSDHLRGIFCGEITNWEALGGPQQDIVVVVPGKGTAAYKNFSLLAIKRSEINYAIMTNRSTMVIDVVQHVPGSISFITKGANERDASVKILKVDGMSHQDKDYPYFQSFSLVTRGQPTGDIKTFVDFVTSEKTAATLRANGIAPAGK